jgi:peroxiredoxin Q/BCP
MLPVDSPAPAFSLPDQDDRTWSLEQLLQRGPLVLYFYPGDFTPVCTKQACTFRDQYEAFAEAGVQVVGVSAQSVESHRKFVDRYDLPFTLLADPAKEAIRAYQASRVLGLLTRRISYFIDTDGMIRDRVHADMLLGAHRDFMQRVLERVGGDEAKRS